MFSVMECVCVFLFVTCGVMLYGMACGIRLCGCVCVTVFQRTVFVCFARGLLCDVVCVCVVCLCVLC